MNSLMNMLKIKMVLRGNGERENIARLMELNKDDITQEKLARLAVESFHLQENQKFSIGLIDEDQDYVILENDDEIRLALQEIEGKLLKIHVKLSTDEKMKKEGNRAGPVVMPKQYFSKLASVSATDKIAQKNDDYQRMVSIIRNHQGVIFVGGELNKFGIKEQLEGNDEKVRRIIAPKRALSIMKKKENGETDADISIMFIPFLAEGKTLRCHVFGSLSDHHQVCVAFKRKGARKINMEFPRKDQDCGKGGKQGSQCKVPRKRMKMLAGQVFDKLEFANAFSLESEELK